MTLTTTNDVIALIKSEMARRGITKYRLSKLTGIPTSTLYRILKSDCSFDLDMLFLLYKALELKFETILPYYQWIEANPHGSFDNKAFEELPENLIKYPLEPKDHI